jgi:hypothetical protein
MFHWLVGRKIYGNLFWIIYEDVHKYEIWKVYIENCDFQNKE